MKSNIVVASTDNNWCQNLITILEKEHINTTQAWSIKKLERLLAPGSHIAAVIDIDIMPITNRIIRELTLRYSGVHFLCLSADRFHPDLKDAICYHIYACIKKPVDLDELLYFIRSIYKDSNSMMETAPPPAH